MTTEYTLRSHLLTQILKNVPFDGWTEDTLHNAATACAINAVSLPLLFPNGIGDVIDFFIQEADRIMVEAIEALPLKEMKIRERIAAAIKIRLEQALPHHNAIRRATAYYALPHHTAQGAHSLWRTADAIWYAIGDSATDHSYYSKRLILSGVYSSTLLFWLDDTSEGHHASWEFLDRRINNALQIGTIPAKVKALGKRFHLC